MDVRMEQETVWLTQRQMADLFDTTPENVLIHLKNIFGDKELEEAATAKDFLVVQTEGKRQVRRNLKHYNLDAIISVGYRVNSRRGVHFRQWATRTLREHLVQGYTLNAQRLAEKGLAEARTALDLLTQTLTGQALVSDEGIAVLGVVRRYLTSFRWLLAYDENRLPDEPAEAMAPQTLGLKDAREAIACLRGELDRQGEATSLFGQEREEGLPAILGNIEQTFGSEPLYPSAQVRAAHLLYFVIKDHPFSDGNKRIATLLFLDYLRRNGLLFRPNGAARFADNAVVALALLIAESAPSQKDLLIRLILALLGDDTA
jgi:prophage maintenance system killer protein